MAFTQSGGEDFLNRLTEITEENLTNERFGVSELAREMGMSRSNLHRKVKSATKTSVSQFIRQVRLNQAMELLRQTSSTASEVAYKVGFGSVTYFTKCFHDYYGFPPGEVGKRESGEHNSGDQTDHAANEAVKKKRLSISILITGFVVVITAIVLLFIFKPFDNRDEILDKSIAVLPFINDSPDQERMYFINGTSNAILDNLSKIEDIRVVSRTSVEQYRNNPKPIPVVAEEMDVSYVLEGSGYRDGDSVRLVVQLRDGRKDQHLWSNTYQGNIEDIFSMLSEIAQQVAGEIEAIITPDEISLIEKVLTESQTAYDLYLRACQEVDWSSDKAVLERAIYLCHSALEYDSSFAHPYSFLAWLYSVLNNRNPIEYASYLDSMIYYADKALSFDNKHEWGYYMRGNYYNRLGQIDRAIEEYDKAIEINPNFWLAYQGKGWLHFANNDFIKSIENFSKVIQLNRGPGLPSSLANLGFAYNQAGFPEKYKELLREKLTLDRDSLDFYKRYAIADITASNYREAIETTFKAYELDTADHEIWNTLGTCYFHLRQFNESFTYYSKYVTRMEELNQFIPFHIPQIAYTYLQIGDKEKSDYYINKLINYQDITSKEADIRGRIMRLSQIYVMKGDIESTYEELSKLAQLERFTTWDNTLRDFPMYDMINTEPEFLQIISEIERKYAVQHERVRQWLEENDML